MYIKHYILPLKRAVKKAFKGAMFRNLSVL